MAQTGTKVRFLASANMHQRKQSGSGTGQFHQDSAHPGSDFADALSSLVGHGLSCWGTHSSAIHR